MLLLHIVLVGQRIPFFQFIPPKVLIFGKCVPILTIGVKPERLPINSKKNSFLSLSSRWSASLPCNTFFKTKENMHLMGMLVPSDDAHTFISGEIT